MSDAQYEALRWLAWTGEIWWHDLPPGTRRVLWGKGWIRESRKIGCATPGHKHPGYVTLSRAGRTALRREVGQPKFGG